MNWSKIIPAAVAVCVLLAGCNKSKNQSSSGFVSNVVTADIQAGIEKHIADQSKLGNGYFRLPFEQKELKLKLVRVHTEYLATLGPGRHFACVDLANTDGNVYDVDFFLAGEPGNMTVTETTVHKLNGQPYYVWEQRKDKTWFRVPYDKALPELLGLKKGSDDFEFIYYAKLPGIKNSAKAWIPIPSSDRFQTIDIESIKAPGKQKILKDSEYGNRVLFLTLTPDDSKKEIELRYNVHRIEKKVYEDETSDPNQFLKPEKLVPADERFKTIAEKVVAGKSSSLVRARALYDYVCNHMKYMKYGSGWGRGDAVYACDAQTGNCTDFHSYFIALCRAVGIPARFAIGAAIPSSRDEGGVDGYHCWAEFYTDGKWWPVDISEGNKCSALSTYYFGHNPANRIEFSKGRDIVVEPLPQSGPINFLAYPVLEVDGKAQKAKVFFSFNRNTSGTSKFSYVD